MSTNTTVISIRINKCDLETINEKAAKEHKSRNAFILERCLNTQSPCEDNADRKIPPYLMCKLQQICNLLEFLEDKKINPIKDEIRKELKELCQW